MEYVSWLAAGDDGSLVDEDDAVCMYRGGIEVVEDDDSGPLFVGELDGSFHDSFLMRHVEGGGGFVEKNDRRGLGDDTGK